MKSKKTVNRKSKVLILFTWSTFLVFGVSLLDFLNVLDFAVLGSGTGKLFKTLSFIFHLLHFPVPLLTTVWRRVPRYQFVYSFLDLIQRLLNILCDSIRHDCVIFALSLQFST